VINALVRENGLFLSFPYVCPEPVLVKYSFIYTNGSKGPFLTQVEASGHGGSAAGILLGRGSADQIARNKAQKAKADLAKSDLAKRRALEAKLEADLAEKYGIRFVRTFER
jgi:hypothetical protein